MYVQHHLINHYDEARKQVHHQVKKSRPENIQLPSLKGVTQRDYPLHLWEGIQSIRYSDIQVSQIQSLTVKRGNFLGVSVFSKINTKGHISLFQDLYHCFQSHITISESVLTYNKSQLKVTWTIKKKKRKTLTEYLQESS